MKLTPIEIYIANNRLVVFWYGLGLAVCMTLAGLLCDWLEGKMKEWRVRK